MNGVQRILKNTFFLFFSNIFAQLLGFIGIIVLARVLGPQDFGKINFALAVIAYFSVIANMGLPLIGAREIARDKNKLIEYLENIMALRLMLALMGFALLLMVAFCLNKSHDIKYLIIFYGIGLIPSALLIDWVFQGIEKMEYIALGRVLFRGIETCLIVLFIRSPQDLLLVPWFQVVAHLIPALLLILLFIRSFSTFKLRLNFVTWKNILAQSMPIGLSIVMVQIYQGIDSVMLGFMRSNEEVGYYNVAHKIIIVLIVAVGAYGHAIYPVIAKYYKTSLSTLEQVLKLTTRLLVSIALPLAVGGTIIAKPIIHSLYGTEYDQGIIALQILLWVVVIMSVNAAKVWGLLACDKQKQYSIGSVVTAAGNVFLNLLLIPKYGLVGAAIATVSAEGIAGAVYHAQFGKIMRIPFLIPVLKSLFASLIMSCVLLVLLHFNPNVGVLILSGMLSYCLFLFLSKGITRQELLAVKMMIIGKTA